MGYVLAPQWAFTWNLMVVHVVTVVVHVVAVVVHVVAVVVHVVAVVVHVVAVVVHGLYYMQSGRTVLRHHYNLLLL